MKHVVTFFLIEIASLIEKRGSYAQLFEPEREEACQAWRWETRVNRPQPQLLLERLKDERSQRVIFVSHCLLNENTRYPGGAFRSGGVDELMDGWQREGVGICQMHCPEQRAWGGVLKRYLLPMYGSRERCATCCCLSSSGIRDGATGAWREKWSGTSRTMYALASRWWASSE